LMRAALAEALHVARHRRAFGKPLIEQPLMANVLADMVLEVEGHIALCLRVAACLEARERDGSAALLARLLIPVAKYWVCQRAPLVVAEAMQAIGGNGYVEDGPLPRLYRQAPLNAIWEGAGNIVCLDVLRVLAREPEAAPLLIRWLGGYRGVVAAYDHALDGLATLLQAPEPAGARRLCEAIALQAQAALLLEDGPSPHALAFGASRLGNSAGHCLGTLPSASDFPAVIARALPD
ncbi:MAG: acyl-CoA dehydrogenase family protein, partial [Porticoccaceae bacterium]